MADVPWNVDSHEMVSAEGTTPIAAPADETKKHISNITAHYWIPITLLTNWMNVLGGGGGVLGSTSVSREN